MFTAELKQKYFEEEQLRVAYNDLVNATKSLESEMEENMTKAQAQVDKVSKKYNALVEKYNELQDKFVNLTVDHERVQNELLSERSEKEALQAVTTETIAKFKALNEELTARVSDLTLENENLNQLYFKATQDAIDSKQELEALYQSKYETEMQLNDNITQLTEELDALRSTTVSVTVVEEMNVKIQQLILEINRLKVLSVNNSVHCTAQYINNTYIENIVNNLNVTNMHITNILQSGDIEVVKSEFVSLLRRYDDVREAESRLLDRLYALLHNFRVVGRTRPASEQEKGEGSIVIESTGELPDINIYDEKSEDWFTYHLDGHWAYDGSQSDLFKDVEPLVRALVPNPLELLQSPQLASIMRNTSALVMGGAGSGRTFTLFGYGDQLGIAYRALQCLFDHLDYRSNQLSKEKAKRSSQQDSSTDPIVDAVFEPSVTMTLYEVSGDQIYDAFGDRPVHPNILFDETEKAVVVSDVSSVELRDINEALRVVHAAVGKIMKRKSSHCYVMGEIKVSIVYHREESPIKARFVFGDIFLDSSESTGDNFGVVNLLRGISEGRDVQELFQKSTITKALQGALAPESKTALLFTFDPTSKSVTSTKANAEIAAMLSPISRTIVATNNATTDPVAMRAVQRKAKKLAHELREERLRSVQIEAKLIETKTVAEEYIVQFNERNKAISKHYEDEKRINQQLQSDLALTLRNLRKAVDELSEQRKVNEKLAALCKLLERERLVLSNNATTA